MLVTEPTHLPSADNTVVLPQATHTADMFSYVSDGNEARVLTSLLLEQLSPVALHSIPSLFLFVIPVPWANLSAHDDNIPWPCVVWGQSAWGGDGLGPVRAGPRCKYEVRITVIHSCIHVAETGAWLEHPCLLQQPDSPTDLRLDYSDENHKTVIVLSSFYF